ncbi:methylmalonyl-CoA mutase family protein [Bacillus sp. FJAT-45350]|uniref:methylmalonyl-CoA mutase family protein n=1 Tax=Bacillus sp. FJAT-45350 TaxID=2011014 RepID=UPI000BB8D96A|nr:methylmalonyl-CoA mutase family protein [Bacillus sp. FJAT-45350]
MDKKILDQFSEFPIPTYEEWREVTEQSLKGVSFEKRLVTNTYEGIALQPMYRHEDAKELALNNTIPGQAPFVRGTEAIKKGAPWLINQELAVATPEQFNNIALHDLSRGQTALNIVLDEPTKKGLSPVEIEAEVGKKGLSISNVEDLEIALKDIEFEAIPLHVHGGAHSLSFLALVIGALKKMNRMPEALSGCIGMDPIGELVRTGSVSYELEECYQGMVDATRWANEKAPNLQTVVVSGDVYHNGGSSAVEELAFSLATGAEYLSAMTSRGVDINNAAKAIRFSFSVGADYFTEIAKLRAARTLWTTIVKAFGGDKETQKMYIHARTSSWTKTVYDPYVNMLRSTSEAFSAAVGGADSIHVSPFDEPIQKSTPFSRRIARNASIILQEEAHIARTVDPAGGSWYVEVLTDKLAQKAWTLFQQVEEKGGILEAIKEKLPQTLIHDIAIKRENNIAHRKDVFVGTNMYANMTEKSLDVISENDQPQIDAHIKKVKQRQEAPVESFTTNRIASAIETASKGASISEISKAFGRSDEAFLEAQPIVATRGSIKFEELRGATKQFEKENGKPIQVFLANLGPIPEHKGRADFTAGFFEVGGFEVLRNNGFSSVEEATEAAIQSGAEVTVICGKDESYQTDAAPLARAIKENANKMTVFVAGQPKEEDAVRYKEAGVAGFIHLRSNCYEVLRKLQVEKGVAE